MTRSYTGHRTVEVVMKHYFRPGRDDFQQAFLRAMPRMLGEGSTKPAKEEMRQIIERITPKTWRGTRCDF